ncbi:paramyosin-like isoform X2 [Haliotis asinina]|uniref:paramyosin-like isoform X2 n=1 Tax=Haliotis asinina TaxID=109174 RepID=UPI00353240F8
MSTKDSWKTFQDQFQKLSETNKSIQNSLKRLGSSKKEKDSAQVKENLSKQLEEATKLLENLQEKVGQTHRDLTSPSTNVTEEKTPREKVGQTHKDLTSPSTNVNKEKTPRQKGRLNPEESEMAYELKAQMMKNIEAENSKLRAEITLHEKIVEVKHLHNQNQKLQEESNLSHTNMVKLLHRFQKKAKETDQKMKVFEEELAKANRLAFRYKDLYDQERQRRGGKGLSPRPDDHDEDTDRITMPAISGRIKLSNSSTLLGNNMRVNDVIRKNECLVDENESLKKEIVKLRQDNAILLKKTKHAMADRDSILHELETCRMSREDVIKRLQKEKSQNQVLARAAARRAQEFVFEKRQQHDLEESLRWRVSGPISAYAAVPRTYSHAVPKNVDQPRGMLPVQDYATANQNSAY